MLQRIDRILLRVGHVGAAVSFYRDVMGLKLIKEDRRLAQLQFPDGKAELILHNDEALPSEATYYLVDDVRRIFERRDELRVQFAQAPSPGALGWRAAIKDPFGNTLLIVDRTGKTDEKSAAIEDGKPPGALFAGVEERVSVKGDALISTYEKIGRTADDLPYTPDFEKLHLIYCSQHPESKPTRAETWRHLLNLRKGGKLPKLGAARSKAPELTEEERARLRELLADGAGRRDRLPYSERFQKLVDAFNAGRARPLSPHLVWRAVAMLTK